MVQNDYCVVHHKKKPGFLRDSFWVEALCLRGNGVLETIYKGQPRRRDSRFDYPPEEINNEAQQVTTELASQGWYSGQHCLKRKHNGTALSTEKLLKVLADLTASEKLDHYVGARLRKEIMQTAQDSVGNDRDWLGELERLAALHKEGQLSDDEYQIAKSKLLGN